MTPGLLREILACAPQRIVPAELMVEAEISAAADVSRLNERQALVAVTDSFTPTATGASARN